MPKADPNDAKEKKSQTSGGKRFMMITIIVLIIIIIILLVRGCGFNPMGQQPERKDPTEVQTGTLVENNETDGKNEQTGYCEVYPMYNFTVSKENPYQTLGNPEGNGYYVTYTFTNSETEEIVYESELVKPGFFWSENFYEDFGGVTGEYKVNVITNIYDMSGNKQNNNVSQNIIVTII